MFRRRSRTKGRRPRVFWVDTFQDQIPRRTDTFPGADSDPTHNQVAIEHIIRVREPAGLEDVDSVLQGKDTGFRLRRIVGDILFLPSILRGFTTANFPGGVRTYISWGVIVHPISEDRAFVNAIGTGDYIFHPCVGRSMSDPWLLKRDLALVSYPAASLTNDPDTFIQLDNSTVAPDGTHVDIKVNRRIKPEEDVSLFWSWNVTQIPAGVEQALTPPAIKMNLRCLVSR